MTSEGNAITVRLITNRTLKWLVGRQFGIEVLVVVREHVVLQITNILTHLGAFEAYWAI